MNSHLTQANRNIKPNIPTYSQFIYTQKNTNQKVNNTNNDRRITENYCNENKKDHGLILLNKPDEIKENTNRSRANKKNISITFACETEDFISSKITQINKGFNHNLNINTNQRNNSSVKNKIETKYESQVENKNVFDIRATSPKYTETKLQSLYFDKNESKQSPRVGITASLDSSKFNTRDKSGLRLYQHHLKTQNKLKSKRNQIEFEFKANMRPNITDKAKNIIRNPDLFEERLYPYHKVNSINTLRMSKSCKIFQLEPILDESKNLGELYGDHSYVNVYRKASNKSFVDYNFKPELNEKSRRIASEMESSKVRLTKKKGKKESADEKILNRSLSRLFSDSNSLSLYGNLLNTETSLNLSIASTRSIARSKALYENAVAQIEYKKALYEDKKKKEEEDYKTYSYKPQLISKPQTNFSTVVPSKDKNENELSALYKRQTEWRRSLIKRQQLIFLKQENDFATMHTFKPVTNKSYRSLDKKFLERMNKHIEHSVSYVKNRRKNIDEKDSKLRRMNSLGENFVIRPTIPNEFKLSELNFKSRENLIRGKVNNLNKLRKELNTQEFFDLEDGINGKMLNNLNKLKVPNIPKPKKTKDNSSYLKMYLEQSITPHFTKESKQNDTSKILNLDSVHINPNDSDEESFYFLNGSKNKHNKLDITFDSKDVVLKALDNINEKYMDFN